MEVVDMLMRLRVRISIQDTNKENSPHQSQSTALHERSSIPSHPGIRHAPHQSPETRPCPSSVRKASGISQTARKTHRDMFHASQRLPKQVSLCIVMNGEGGRTCVHWCIAD